MKTQIITLFTALVLGLGVANTTYAATAKNTTENVTVLNDITAISKIEVYGNVELYVSDGSKDQVKVYNKYYTEGALVQSKNGVLRISSYKAEKLVVWVTANDLRAISAFDNSVVKSFGNLSKIEFEVDLHNNATAKLDLDAYSANVTVSDQAKANLSGTASEFDLKCNNAGNVDQNNLITKHASKTVLNTTASVKRSEIDELADL
ncbi:GIN domain-containing protein [Mucilaginibacter sp.]|uniref:GIN domain-containing protein n=1 Tax=Mucilaginibacter sp. TaxID=1882438 RepID=UPI003D0BB2C7